MFVSLTLGSIGNNNFQLSSPFGVVQDPISKTLYVVDYGNQRVMSYAQGSLAGSRVAGGSVAGLNTTLLINPTGIYLDSVTNSLFIANFGAYNIVRWPLGASSWTLVAGSINGSLGSSTTLLSLPTGVTLDPMGNVYVADAGNSRIQFFPAGQTVGTTIAGMSGFAGSNASQLLSPYTVRLDSQLNLYVADTGNNRVQKYLRY